MIKSECSKKDCFFKVGDMCCNLCAPGNDSCSLYWALDQDTSDRAPAGAPSRSNKGDRNTSDGHLAVLEAS